MSYPNDLPQRPYRNGRTYRQQDIEQPYPYDDDMSYQPSAHTRTAAVQRNNRHNTQHTSLTSPRDSSSPSSSSAKHRRPYYRYVAITVPLAALVLCCVLFVTQSGKGQVNGGSWLPQSQQLNRDLTNTGLQPSMSAPHMLLQQQHTTLQVQHDELRQQYDALHVKYNALSSQPVAAAVQQACPACAACPQQAACPKCDTPAIAAACAGNNLPLQPGTVSTGYPLPACRGIPVPALPNSDLAFNTKFSMADHDITWNVCMGKQVKHTKNTVDNIQYCEQTSRSEHYWQLQWYNRMDGKNKTQVIKRDAVVSTPNCVQLPPDGYAFPPKYPTLPADLLADADPAKRLAMREMHRQVPVEEYAKNKHDYYNWPNLRVDSIQDLLQFNAGTPKNLYHFDAIFYDNQQMGVIETAAQYIPFQQKVRLMLDMGSGGASLGLLIQRLYDVHVINTIFADWPYCEYISDRGGACMLLDAMNAMPFAKYTFDVVHAAWLYHDKKPDVLWDIFNEQNRVIRPGGYLWWAGGFSKEQVQSIELYAGMFGYKTLLNEKKPQPPGQFFGTYSDIPYEITWNAIWVKPVKAVISEQCDTGAQIEKVKKQLK